MYEHEHHHHQPQDHSPFRIAPAGEPAQPQAESAPAREADPYEVIDFLLQKAEDQQQQLTAQAAKLAEHDEYAQLQSQEIESLKAQLEAAKKELEQQLADYDVLMQNTLMVEHELEQFKQKSTEKPKIQLPFYTEQKLAKLGYGHGEEGPALEDRQAV